MSYIGRHRKPSTASRIHRRLALGAVVAGAVTTTGLATAQAADIATLSSGADIVNNLADATGLAPASGVVRPAEGTFTSGYGERWGTSHQGMDIANSIGTPIVAVMDGTVIDSGPASGFGQWIRILHNDGSISVYGHMETLNVSVGQSVSAGQHIAGMGSRGYSTGSHLHFEVHPAGSGPVDPVTWFANHGIYY